MRKISTFLLTIHLLFSQTVLSQNHIEETKASRPIEYTRQAFLDLELPLYSLYFLAKLPSYLSQPANLQMDLISSLNFLDTIALIHLGLFLGSTLESQYAEDTGDDADRVVPGFNFGNDTSLDQILKAERELYMPAYGGLVALLKTCVALGICVPGNGKFAFLVDQYFPFENLMIPTLKIARKTLHEGQDVKFENRTFSPVEPFLVSSSLDALLNMGFIFTGLVQLAALQSPAYTQISTARSLFLVGAFNWIGLNNYPFLVDQTVRLLNYTAASLEAKKTDL